MPGDSRAERACDQSCSFLAISNVRFRDKKETLTQNYRRLGLISRLQLPTGGAEQKIHEKVKNSHALDLKRVKSIERTIVSEARVERDAEGNITRIIRGASMRANPLNDPLNEFDSDEDEDGPEEQGADHGEWGGIEDEEEPTEVVRLLEAEASVEYEKRPRGQSEMELEWLRRLVRKHGDDVEAMVWDKKLNPMQQTAGDLTRRIKRWKGSL